MRTTVARALVVDDDAAWQSLVVEILADSGLLVDTASSLGEALPLIYQATHQLAVVDLALDGSDHLNHDGLQVLAGLQQYNPGCPAILLTGYATGDLAARAVVEFGALTCLRKDAFQRGQFRKLIQQVLSNLIEEENVC
jgi:DNA-binding NtrC family response regulator